MWSIYACHTASRSNDCRTLDVFFFLCFWSKSIKSRSDHTLMLEIFVFLRLDVSPQSPNGSHSTAPAAGWTHFHNGRFSSAQHISLRHLFDNQLNAEMWNVTVFTAILFYDRGLWRSDNRHGEEKAHWPWHEPWLIILKNQPRESISKIYFDLLWGQRSVCLLVCFAFRPIWTFIAVKSVIETRGILLNNKPD